MELRWNESCKLWVQAALPQAQSNCEFRVLVIREHANMLLEVPQHDRVRILGEAFSHGLW